MSAWLRFLLATIIFFPFRLVSGRPALLGRPDTVLSWGAVTELDPDLEPGFPVQTLHTPGTYTGGAGILTLAGDINGDQKKEVLVSGLANGPLFAWNSDGTPVAGWPVWLTANTAYPALGTLDPTQPGLQVFSGYYSFRVPESSPGALAAFSGSGAILPGWPRYSANFLIAPPVLADVNGDGIDEIFVNENDLIGPTLHAYLAGGSPLPGWPVESAYGIPAIADLDYDGALEIATYLNKGTDLSGIMIAETAVYRPDGSRAPGYAYRFRPSTQAYPAVGDVDGDGMAEIIIPGITNDWLGVIYVIGRDGLERSIPLAGAGTVSNQAALGDLDGDGAPEIVAQLTTGLTVARGDGTILQGWPVVYGRWVNCGATNSAPVVGDVNGDMQPEIVITDNCGANARGEARVYDRSGHMVAPFPKAIDIQEGAVPAIADLDLDGRSEIVITGSYWDGISGERDKVWVYDLKGEQYGRVEWGQLGNNPQHRGAYLPPPAPSEGVDLRLEVPPQVLAPPGAAANLSVRYENLGQYPASGIVLTATLPALLTYLGSTASATPTVHGQQVTWQLTPLTYPLKKGFDLRVGLPGGAAAGDRYRVEWQIGASGIDSQPQDNGAVCELIIARQLYLPLLAR